MVARTQTSAAGVLALLSEQDEPVVRQHALKALLPLVPQFWAEISEHVATIESLYESDELPRDARDLAALLVSKVYFYLGEYDEALSFALGAGRAFEAESRSTAAAEFIETIVSKAIDRYITVRADDAKDDKIDPRLKTMIEGIFTRCLEDGEYKQALGIALEARRLDVIERVYKESKDVELLSYIMEAVLESGFKLSYRDQVLNFLLPLFPPPAPQSSHIPALTRLYVTLSSTPLTVKLLQSLVPKEKLLAYQFAFDFVEGGTQDFLESVRTALPEGTADEKGTYDQLRQILSGEESIKHYREFLGRNNKVDLLILKSTKDALEARSSIYHNAVTFSNAFMHCGTASDVFLRENLDWLVRASNWSKFSATAALGVIHKGYFEKGLELLGPYLPAQEAGTTGSVFSEGGALFALGLVNAGKGKDVEGYLRDKLKNIQNEVVQHGAALGLGIAGMASGSEDAFEDLKTTLFNDSAVAGEAAGIGMGLVMLGSGGQRFADEMLQYAHDTQHEKIIRGLALGVAFLYYGRQEEADGVIQSLLSEKDGLLRYGGVYTLALAYAGTSDNNAIRKLLHIAVSDTSDDVRRAAVTCLAFVLFKNPTQMPRLVQLLSESYNPHVRCGATLALGLSCAGTGLQDAVEILEPMIKDPVDFVRQGALIALGMVLVQQSEASSPSMSSTRALYARIVGDKHEDPMARFGSALGQGLIDAGGRNVTISLSSRTGSTNMAAVVGMALFCQFWYWFPLAHCASLAFEPTGIIGLNEDLKVPKFEVVSNARPSLFAYPPPTKPPTKAAVEKVETAVLSTTAKAKARESRKKAAADDSQMDTDEKPEKKESDDAMKVDDAGASGSKARDVSPLTQLADAATAAGAGTPSTSTPKPKRTVEPSSEKLSNFSRVTPTQFAYISFPPEGKFQPVRAISTVPPQRGAAASTKRGGKGAALAAVSKTAGGGGILLLIDTKPQEAAEFIDLTPPAPAPAAAAAPAEAAPAAASAGSYGGMVDENGPEADMPPAFEYPFDA
ncbi:26S proteasome regulatory complex, non-ATPase subcomplex, Rpn2/Psmd1 subunit [Exidia glandulosa HHB12029]|uniref:26S proteasome regulatory subunit RPN2 n=1 Tax=Exidia glandulosa HHB12029 TaxID=1314781 RepID=A0A165HUD4_EXIGL|nr:26S proteasome regulatory complex, non-ATPase subcomplex, Rpn2/Psmd1 subunit [Exidia glandulosa HHB12029]